MQAACDRRSNAARRTDRQETSSGDKMRAHLTQLCLVGLVSALGACGASAQVTTWQVDGETREGIVYAPPAAHADESLPLILAFHGFGDNMQNFQGTNVHGAWPDAVVVYFQGLERRRGLLGWQVEGAGVDRDLKLVDVALASLRQTYNIDDDRIYATGFSNGGMFTYLLWAERPGVFAAFAPVAGRLRESARPTHPRPLFHVAGERDGVVSFSDQQASIEAAGAVNGVGDTTAPCGNGCTIYGPKTPAPVMAWIHPGGHSYPRETSDRIVAFFRDHPRTHP